MGAFLSFLRFCNFKLINETRDCKFLNRKNIINSGVIDMMGYWWGNQGMMGWEGAAFVFSLFWVVSFIDLVLLGLWLWKQLKKK